MEDKTNIFTDNNYGDIVGSNKIFLDDDYKEMTKFGKIVNTLSSSKFVMVISIFILVLTTVLTSKALFLRLKVNSYEEIITTIERKESTMVTLAQEKQFDHESLKKVAAEELIACINTPLDMNNLPDSVNAVINQINNYYNQSNDYFSFKYKDIYTGFTVSYNENQVIFTASTIKGPTDIYIYEMASQGKINLDEKIKYTGYYVNGGSGVLKNKPINTEYDVRTLLKYSTVYSDNAAHNMLMDKFGRQNMYNFWKNKGTKDIFSANNNWGVTSAHDATIYMEELYQYYINDEKNGEELMSNFLNSTPKFLINDKDVKIASKSGWSGSAVHDVAIMFDENPYIVVALSNLGETNYSDSYFWKVSELSNKLHKAYWKYKMESCNKISQY